MNIKNKKIVAREVLLFAIFMIIGLVTYLYLKSYNYFENKKINDITNAINLKERVSDSLNYAVDSTKSADTTGQVDEGDLKIKNIEKELTVLRKEKDDYSLKVYSIPETMKIILVITFIILFAIRYLFYAIKWSITTLKK